MSRLLKIKLFGNYAYSKSGGVEVFTWILAKELAKRGHRVQLICIGDEHRTEITNPMLRVDVLKGISDISLPFTLQAFSILRKDFDIAHATVPNPFTSIMAAVLSLVCRKPLVLTVMSFPTKYGPISDVYNFLVLPVLFSLSSAIVVPTHSFAFNGRLRAFFLKYRHKLKRIPFIVDLQIFRPSLRTELKLTDNEKLVLFVGVLDKQHWFKGLEYLLEAFKILRGEKKPSYKLIVVGDGNRRHHYEELTSKLGLTPHVKFLGDIPNKELPRIYNACDLFVLPSISDAESFGIVLAEAMACGKPVIGSKVGGIPEVIEGCGLLVPPKNSRALAEAIYNVLEDNELASLLGREALVKARPFSKESVTTQCEYLYNSVTTTKVEHK